MADGSIVYEVRVDSGNVNADLSAAAVLLEKGTQDITRITAEAALNLGKMLGNIFNDFGKGALVSLNPVLDALTGMSKINLSNIGAVTGKIPAASSSANTNTANSNIGNAVLSRVLPSFAVGTSYIPYDDFPALLHKGEAVLTATENAALKAAGGIGALHDMSQSPGLPSSAGSSADSDFGKRPVEVTLKIGDYEFTQIIADTMNDLYRQWGKNPLN